jgi:predicted tellurium resistance membrane protein TerC
MELVYTANFWISLSTLTLLELILGVDNLVFLAIVTSQLPKKQQKSARRIGLVLACMMRLLLLAVLSSIMKLTQPLFVVFQQPFSARDLILIIGGLFLIVKATQEIHKTVEGTEEKPQFKRATYYLYVSVILQIMLLDMIFSLDSVITAIGLTQEFLVMGLAICIAITAMIFASEPLTRFINTYPTLKILALSFLFLIGAVLVADGCGIYIPRGYLYFAIVFSIFVESINLVTRKRQKQK